MSDARVLSIELEQWSTRPVGHITDQSGHSFAFDGWVSLAAALERICADDPPDQFAGAEPERRR